jgi:hypothetical protein
MQTVRYCWDDADGDHRSDLVPVRGTHGEPYTFGDAPAVLQVEVPDFFIASLPVTQRLWTRVMSPGANPAANRGPELPLENVSWNELTKPGGFLHRLDGSSMAAAVREIGQHSHCSCIGVRLVLSERRSIQHSLTE